MTAESRLSGGAISPGGISGNGGNLTPGIVVNYSKQNHIQKIKHPLALKHLINLVNLTISPPNLTFFYAYFI